MISKAFNAIKTSLEDSFPRLKVVIGWLGPERKETFPYLSIINVSQEQIHWGSEFLDRTQDDSGSVQVVHRIGEWRCRVDLHHHSKNQKDLTDFIDNFNNFFKTGVQSRLSNRSLVIDFGDKFYEKLTFTYMNYSLDQSSFPLQKGRRRGIFECMAYIPDLIYEDIPIMTDVKIDERSKISENTDLTPVSTP